MNINRTGCGGGRSCIQCIEHQKMDEEIYTGIKRVEYSYGLRREAIEPDEKKMRAKTI